MEYKTELANLRGQIDEIDKKILELINKRAQLAQMVGHIKKKHNLPIFVPSREREIFERIERLNPGPLSGDIVKHIFREIISACRSIEESIKVAYLGPKATFTHQASLKYFGSSVEHIPVSTIKDVFEEIIKKKADFGVVPVENTIEGVVNYTLDMFLDYDLKIIGEIILEISLHLMSINPNKNQIQRIYSHKFGIAECRDWLLKNMPHAQLIEVESTAKAAEIAKDDYESAAIASESAATVYGLHILERKIDRHLFNYTRFLVIGNRISKPTGNDKTSFIFSVHNEAGALYRALEPFYKNSINMTKIESRPSKKEAWEYVFFADIEGHIEEEKVKSTLEELGKSTPFFKILGSYPKAEIP